MMIASGTGPNVRFRVCLPIPGASRLIPSDLRPIAPSLVRRVLMLGLVLAGAGWRPLAAQSLSAGAVGGTVRSVDSLRVGDASVSLIDDVTGTRRVLQTPRNGSFSFELLLPGDYTLLIERFGYRPLRILSVPVRAGALVRVDPMLRPGGPESGIDTVAYRGVPAGGTHLALIEGHAPNDLARIADTRLLATGASSLFPGTGDGMDAEGLPGALGAIAADGVTRWSPRHPRLPGADLDGLAFPLDDLRGLGMMAGGTDAEWPGAGGGVLSALTIPGARRLSSTLSLSGGGDGGTGALVLSGPIVRDTANFLLGVSAVRLNPQLPAPWADSAGTLLASIAQDSFQTDLTGYQRAERPVTTIISGFGRFDWAVAQDHRLSVRASGASTRFDRPSLGPDQLPVVGARLSTRDISVAAMLTSVLSPRVGNEVRVAVDAGNRDYAAPPLAGTVFAGDGLSAGASTLQPGVFKRTTVRLGETAHLRLARGSLKAGLQGTFTTFDQSYADNRAGSFFFGDTTGFASRTGVFTQTVGTLPTARFKTSMFGLFAQALLRPSPVLELQLGARYDAERLPVSQIVQNSEWVRLTGIDNSVVPKSNAQLSPRAAFTWTLGATRAWQVEGEAARFAEPALPGEWAEALTHATGLSVRRGAGALGAWPALPDSTAAPIQGTSLTLLGPDYRSPRTGRVRFGLSGNVGGVLVRMQGTYRHTDYLPVRRDLNLPQSPRAHDQYGRVIYGSLAQYGGVLAAVPGSNRRFSAFDAVYSLDPSGYSDYWGASVSLERDVWRGLNLLAAYTYSRTTDNWFGARAGLTEAQLLPLTDSTGRSTWADGRSDFDVPHRLVLGAQARFGSRVRLAALYRWHSGYPFTPGFRDGVDANGDGSVRNDPAFVTDTVSGAGAVIAANSCLAGQAGRFVERNSCRDPAVGALDLRLVIGLGQIAGGMSELTFDAFDVVHSGGDVMDHALYLVDPAQTLTTNAGTGVTTVPLIANPNFGRTLVRLHPGAMFRVGLKVTL